MERSAFKRLTSGRGAVMILAAFLMPLFLFLAGAAVDAGRAFVFKSELNKAAMIAAEEASKEINMGAAQESGSVNLNREDFENTVKEYFFKNILLKENYRVSSLEINVFDSVSNPRYIVIKCRSEIDCFFLKMFGINSIFVNSGATGRLRRLK